MLSIVLLHLMSPALDELHSLWGKEVRHNSASVVLATLPYSEAAELAWAEGAGCLYGIGAHLQGTGPDRKAAVLNFYALEC